MTIEEAKAKQAKIAQNYNLSWWYGTGCTKCCEVYPKAEFEGNLASQNIYYICEVCGKRTKGYEMPWLATEAWNRGEYMQGQIRMF